MRSGNFIGSAETGLDYFGARYFSGAQGRFTTPDPIHIMPQKLLDPQQWNMYAYVRNNPLRLIDPTGEYICGGTENECKEFEEARKRDLKSKKESVRNAAGAYGAAGTDNGVNVKFGDPGDGHGGSTTVGLRQLGDGTWQATADVVIKKGSSGNALDAVLGHEGVHVEDAQDFAKTITADFNYDLSKNLTHWQTEMNAYAVTAAIDSGHSYGVCGTGQCVLGSKMSARAVAATTMLLLANPANGYNRFIDAGTGQLYTGQGSPVNVLGTRQFSAITDPNPQH
jgi:RHS repeat-associated protein